MSLEQGPIITDDEARFIAKSGQPPLTNTQARDFLRENSERFNLEIAPDEPI